VRPAGVPVEIRWDRDERVRSATLRKGEEPVVVTGAPAELAMFLFGRAEHAPLDFSGPEAAVRALRHEDLGV
jgi:hypothetical protein